MLNDSSSVMMIFFFFFFFFRSSSSSNTNRQEEKEEERREEELLDIMVRRYFGSHTGLTCHLDGYVRNRMSTVRTHLLQVLQSAQRNIG